MKNKLRSVKLLLFAFFGLGEDPLKEERYVRFYASINTLLIDMHKG